MKRTIIADGDAMHVVTRTARKYPARAKIVTELGDSLTLEVDRDGHWRLAERRNGGVPTTLVYGALPCPDEED